MLAFPIRTRASSALAAVMVSVAAIACSSGSSAPPKPRPPPLVSVAAVEAKDVAVEARAPVDLRPIAQADVGSKILGYIDAVLVDRGDRVKKGQLIALVRPSDLPDQLSSAKSSVAQATANRHLSQINADRAAQLAPEGLVPQSDLERARATLDASRAAEETARAQLAALATRLGETRIESPLDGFVLTRRLDPGALVGPPGGGAIVTVARTELLRVFIDVNERESQGVHVGLDAHVEVDALPGKSFAGKVVRISPAFDPVTRTLQAEVVLDNQNDELRPGMYGHGAIRIDVHPHAPVIPAAAMQVSSKTRYVFVAKGDKVERRTIETGVDGGDWLEVTRGLAPGEEVVIAGADGLSDGASIRRAQPGAQSVTGGSSATPQGMLPAMPSGAPHTGAPRPAGSEG
ncbi:MAG: efflux RND transporter periplasmic adaptor subunit [Byssovorax sp.]